MQNQKIDLKIYYRGLKTSPKDDFDTMSAEEYIRATKRLFFISKYKSYRNVEIICRSNHRIGKTFLVLLSAKMLAAKKVILVSESQNTILTFGYLTKEFYRLLYDKATSKKFIKRCTRHIDELMQSSYNPRIDPSGTPYYLRCDYTRDYVAGGSIGHIAGVSNNLFVYYGKLVFATSDYIPTVSEAIEQKIIQDNDELYYSNISDITGLYFNKHVERMLIELANDIKPMFLYQRSALNQFAGIEFAINYNIPLVLEYNGSEAWIRANWSGKKKFLGTELSREIEMLSFDKASLIVCVSKPLKDELVGWGIDPSKIVVIPNGVDTNKYRPDVDGRPVRNKLGISDKHIVVGFIGTFGAWHGAEVLAEAAVKVLSEKNDVNFVFVGDGKMMPKVKEIIFSYECGERCHFTGIVPQQEGKNFLAACDILVSPQIPNPDGTPFFGSPTKLFEYMAMGKAIVVSNMDQMAEICSDEEDALLSKPGDSDDLYQKIIRLCNDYELRMMLGKNARKKVCDKYTWKIVTESIINELEKRI